MTVQVLHGDSAEVLKDLAANSVDAVVTDPPYALNFMGKAWDVGDTAFAVSFWKQVFRVLKPGGHVVAASATRTYHRLAVAIEDAGFEIRDQVLWLYGSGFPKSMDVSKAIDKLDAVAVRRDRALRFTAWMRSTGITSKRIQAVTGTVMASHYLTDKEQPCIATREHLEAMRPHLGEVPDWVEQLVDQRTVESENFKGRKVVGQHDSVAHAAAWRAAYAGGAIAEAGKITEPRSADAVQWDGWGTALKPACEPWVLARKPFKGTIASNVLDHGTGALNIDGCRILGESTQRTNRAEMGYHGGNVAEEYSTGSDSGRFPANVIHDGSPEVVVAFPTEPPSTAPSGGDEASAARFFYSAKADAEDRLGSRHPTVKPVDLMAWLCRLVTPPGGVVLDPFAGTGTTGAGCLREGFECILIEREAEYVADIERRMAWARGEGRLTSLETAKLHTPEARLKASGEDLPLFGGAE